MHCHSVTVSAYANMRNEVNCHYLMCLPWWYLIHVLWCWYLTSLTWHGWDKLCLVLLRIKANLTAQMKYVMYCPIRFPDCTILWFLEHSVWQECLFKESVATPRKLTCPSICILILPIYRQYRRSWMIKWYLHKLYQVRSFWRRHLQTIQKELDDKVILT